jgi:hypothetical protein
MGMGVGQREERQCDWLGGEGRKKREGRGPHRLEWAEAIGSAW